MRRIKSEISPKLNKYVWKIYKRFRIKKGYKCFTRWTICYCNNLLFEILSVQWENVDRIRNNYEKIVKNYKERYTIVQNSLKRIIDEEKYQPKLDL